MPPLPVLFGKDKVPASILLPAGFVRFGAERLFLAKANCLDAVGADAGGNQGVLHRTGAAVAERKVVFRRPALVAVTLNRECDIRVLLQERHVRLNRGLLISANVGLVVVEINVFDVLAE